MTRSLPGRLVLAAAAALGLMSCDFVAFSRGSRSVVSQYRLLAWSDGNTYLVLPTERGYDYAVSGVVTRIGWDSSRILVERMRDDSTSEWVLLNVVTGARARSTDSTAEVVERALGELHTVAADSAWAALKK